jgi:site-specific DNA-cytosine methylase
MPLRVVGFLAGVGSLLREAQDAGFMVMGNLETRGPYHSARDLSWDLNFPNIQLFREPTAFMQQSGVPEADLALGHPPCGSHSVLGNSSAYSYGRFANAKEREDWHEERRKDKGLLPLFVQQVNALKPRSFALDNLPKILRTSAPPEWWKENLPQYHLTFIVMKNWDYGTPQRRERLWVVGIRKPGKPFVFKEPKQRLPGPKSALEAFAGTGAQVPLSWEPWTNIESLGHVHVEPDNRLTGDYRTTVKGLDVTCAAQLGLGFLSIPPERAWPYTARHGHVAVKIGRMRLYIDKWSKVITGLPSIHHPYTGWPLTPRERARLMDWPDDFQLGQRTTTYDRRALMRLTLYTGKAVPSGFPRYLIPQLVTHLKRRG